jgi:hypothetical protein
MSKGGSRVGLIVGGAAAGCLVILCLGLVGGGAAYYYLMRADDGDWRVDGPMGVDAVEIPADTFAEVAWGEVQLSASPTSIYAQADRSSAVLETRAAGTTVEYFGLDGSAAFFKVKARDGTMGYVSTSDAEMAVHQGEIKIIVESARVYAAGSDDSGVVEIRDEGERLDWYGYDSSGEYYKVRTGSGSNGYIRVTDATIP